MKPDKCAFCRMTRGPCTYRYHLYETLRRGAWWRIPVGLVGAPIAIVLFVPAVFGVFALEVVEQLMVIIDRALADILYLCGGRK